MGRPATVYRDTFMRCAVGALLASAAWLASPAVGNAAGVTPALQSDIVKAVDADTARLTKIFKDIHQNPELAFMETRTAGVVAKELKSLGFQVSTGIGKTGVVAVLRNGEGPTVMYRADMDANPVEEATGLDYASKIRVKRADGVEVPVAHMCGHDAHVTWMLGMAKVLAGMRDKWSGTLVLVGQPAEENISGAKAMVDGGLYEAAPVPDYYLALHTAPIASGLVLARGGVIQAGTVLIDVTFQGVGGHGSTPQFTRDPVVMGAYAVTEYQALVSRVIPPLDMAVLTVGAFQAGTDANVIPETATLKINLRYYSDSVRRKLIDGIRAIDDGIAKSYGTPDDKLPLMTVNGTTSPLTNDGPLVERLITPLEALLGANKVITDFPPSTGSEDAHVLVEQHPQTKIAYMAVGIAEPKAAAAAQARGEAFAFSAHGPKYVVELDTIPLGTKVAAVSVLDLLAK